MDPHALVVSSIPACAAARPRAPVRVRGIVVSFQSTDQVSWRIARGRIRRAHSATGRSCALGTSPRPANAGRPAAPEQLAELVEVVVSPITSPTCIG
jgi:hypothetical protein